ncbi:hypothetical protein [Kurthia sibirica]|nr:hypothetical protein [Kurthia sibirica]GEK34262.1 hypothetical protein KSI01_17950 [Kurthia sibirica]
MYLLPAILLLVILLIVTWLFLSQYFEVVGRKIMRFFNTLFK